MRQSILCLAHPHRRLEQFAPFKPPDTRYASSFAHALDLAGPNLLRVLLQLALTPDTQTRGVSIGLQQQMTSVHSFCRSARSGFLSTLAAWGPLGPSTISNSTQSPSDKVRYP